MVGLGTRLCPGGGVALISALRRNMPESSCSSTEHALRTLLTQPVPATRLNSVLQKKLAHHTQVLQEVRRTVQNHRSSNSTACVGHDSVAELSRTRRFAPIERRPSRRPRVFKITARALRPEKLNWFTCPIATNLTTDVFLN